MKKILACVKDAKSRDWNAPALFDSIDFAKRAFGSLVTHDENSLVAMYPADFDLWHLGDYDVSTGVITAFSAPVHLANGLDFKGV